MNLPVVVKYPVIAIGDVHGHIDLLNALLAKLSKVKEWDKATLVFLGDFCDRGPATDQVLERIAALVEMGKATAVRGNHDQALIRATGLDGLKPSAYWAGRYRDAYESGSTFRAYLGRLPRAAHFGADLALLKAAMPARHRNLLASLPWLVETERTAKRGHLFLHCGLSQELRLDAAEQLDALRDQQWSPNMAEPNTYTAQRAVSEYPVWFGADRNSSDRPLPCPGRVQVSGHVVVSKPQANAVRIRLDTSGGQFAPLTAAVLTSATAKPRFVASGTPAGFRGCSLGGHFYN